MSADISRLTSDVRREMSADIAVQHFIITAVIVDRQSRLTSLPDIGHYG